MWDSFRWPDFFPHLSFSSSPVTGPAHHHTTGRGLNKGCTRFYFLVSPIWDLISPLFCKPPPHHIFIKKSYCKVFLGYNCTRTVLKYHMEPIIWTIFLQDWINSCLHWACRLLLNIVTSLSICLFKWPFCAKCSNCFKFPAPSCPKIYGTHRVKPLRRKNIHPWVKTNALPY